MQKTLARIALGLKRPGSYRVKLRSKFWVSLKGFPARLGPGEFVVPLDFPSMEIAESEWKECQQRQHDLWEEAGLEFVEYIRI